ncbi:MAG: gamma-glutamylcyclotransferase [Cyanobacteriota bacterium]|nr:gamma-glutamylcyclotransferase [Cyanobacteriota bacterium]
MEDTLISVFVYGTLKPDECNYRRYCLGKVVQERPACALGQLFDLPFGYPAMTVGEDWVSGVILSFGNPSVIEDLDRLEDYQPHRPVDQNEYQRQRIQTYTPDRQLLEVAWVYVMNPAKIQEYRGIYLPDGNWSSELRIYSSDA